MPKFDYTTPAKDFNHLSIEDLLSARDQFHYHLMRKKHVVATAVGYYLIRKDDPYPPKSGESKPAKTYSNKHKGRSARTLWNSEVRYYSWPCVLVFVDEWVKLDSFNNNDSSETGPLDLVEKNLETSDGKTIPVCVVKAPPEELIITPVQKPVFPDRLIGGGFPVLADVQGREHIASIGCLVTDGHNIYALTNRHVSGKTGEPIYSLLGGKKVEIGRGSDKQLTKLPFEMIYPHWPAKNIYLTMDIGLIEINDINQWSSQIYGMGKMGKLADLGLVENYLNLIGCPVRAYGCASGQMKGSIWGLFYRYKAVGGFEYVSDFLIGPGIINRESDENNAAFSTHPGDSGTVWLLDTGDSRGLMPLAVQWGGQSFSDSGNKQSFALATSLSSVCSQLDVDLIKDLNLVGTDYWGATGHFTIANKACDALTSSRLKKLIQANLENITYSTEDIGSYANKHFQGLSKADFIPLADVPDYAWKIGKYSRGNPEHPNHFADMDKPSPKHNNKTLLELCIEDEKNIDVDFWLQYYAAVGDRSKGLLPFRVWQFFQGMVDYIKKGKVAEFICTAGILSHYLGDAGQPLHISYLFDGDPADTVLNEKTQKEEPRAKGVHHAYEALMVDYHSTEILEGIIAYKLSDEQLHPINTPRDAAVAAVQLMKKTFDCIQPEEIIDVFIKSKDEKPRQMADIMWETFGDRTIELMAESGKFLAHLWESAWKLGNGKQNIKNLGQVDKSKLINLYNNSKFMESVTLKNIKPLLTNNSK